MNALVDNGWLGLLTPTELKVWLVYHRYANDAGVAFPGVKKLLKLMKTVRADHLRRARERLLERGLLLVDGDRFRVITPQRARSKGTAAAEVERRPSKPADQNLVTDPPKFGDQNLVNDSPKSALGIARNLVAHKEEQLREHLIEHLTPAEPAAASAAAGRGEEQEGRRRRTRERKLSDAQVETWKAFMDWWIGIYPRFHKGDDYEWNGPRDAPAALKFLKKQKVAWDLDRAKQIAEYFLGIPEIHFPEHLLPILAYRANAFARKLDEYHANGRSHVIGITGKPSAEQRGQFPEPARPAAPQFGAGGGRAAAAG